MSDPLAAVPQKIGELTTDAYDEGMAGVTSDFFQDVRLDFETLLSEPEVRLPDAGTEAHITGKVRLLATEYFHQVRRRIPTQPREVLWSNELRMRAWSAHERNAVERIADELKRGDDTTPRMSRSSRKSVRETVADNSYDGLLTDWGIHHLHLGDKVEGDGFVERTRALLFVFIKDATAHLVDVLEHPGSFTNHRLFQIIHDNWPDAIAEWRIPGAIPGSLSPSYEPSARRQTRSKLVMGTAAVDGTAYLPASGGVMMSGHSFEAAGHACRLLNLVHPAEVWVQEHAEWLRGSIARNIGPCPETLRLRFETRIAMSQGRAAVSESQTRIRFLGIPPDGRGIVRVGVPAHIPPARPRSSLATGTAA